MAPGIEKPKYNEVLTIHINGTLKNLQSKEKYVPGMDIVQLVHLLSTKRVGYQRHIQKYIKLEKGIPIMPLNNEAKKKNLNFWIWTSESEFNVSDKKQSFLVLLSFANN